jgi:hypothetical protein
MVPVEIMQTCASVRGATQGRSRMPVDHRLGRPEGHWPALLRLCRPVQAQGHGLAEVVQVWISARQAPEHGTAEQRSCKPVKVSVAWALQSRDHECLWIASLAGLRGPPSEVEVVQTFADLRGTAQKGSLMSVGHLFGRLKELDLLRLCGSEG